MPLSNSKPEITEHTAENDPRIRIMLVDDSSVIRRMMSRILSSDEDVHVVKSVPNGKLAVDSIETARPDVIILDIEMPVMDGLTALPLLRKKDSDVKIIIFSTLSKKGADVTLKALNLGATDCLLKPSSFTQTDHQSYQKELLHTVKTLGQYARRNRLIKSGKIPLLPKTEKKHFVLCENDDAYTGKPSIIVIGSSTGGPAALPVVLKHFKNLDMPIVITQHMPPTFTAVLAASISTKLDMDCVEAAQGMPVKAGRVYIAPGGFHMKLVQDKGTVFIELDDGPKENFCKPSVEPMLRSVVDIYGRKALAVILTGMGKDGAESCKYLIESNGRMIAQDEKTSIVWGMPGTVAMDGLCSAVLPLDSIGPWVTDAIVGKHQFAKASNIKASNI